MEKVYFTKEIKSDKVVEMFKALNKELRKKTTAQFSTFIPRSDYDEINEFLKKNNITKVELIYQGYEALKEMINKK